MTAMKNMNQETHAVRLKVLKMAYAIHAEEYRSKQVTRQLIGKLCDFHACGIDGLKEYLNTVAETQHFYDERNSATFTPDDIVRTATILYNFVTSED